MQELKDRLIGVTEEGKSLREGIQVKLAKIQRLEEKLEALKSVRAYIRCCITCTIY